MEEGFMKRRFSMKAFLLPLAVVAALAVNAAHAGSLTPAPRVVATYDRNFIERSGAQTLEELLDTGIIRYFLTGGQSLLVLVNGRPYSSTDGDLEPLPLSAVERIEVLGGESLGSIGGTARGALNIVLRTDLDGFETRKLARAPSRDGGDAWQGSTFWGGAFGKGRMTLGADVIDRQEIPGKRREHSRSEWVEGGEFSQAKNVSVSGNTGFVVKLDTNGDREEDGNGDPLPKRSVALGDCDPAKGYVPGLSNPPGITSGDKGCGFAYGNIWWDTRSREQQSAILNLDHPLGDDAELHLDANITQSETALRYAPSVAVFSVSIKDENNIVTNQALLDAINAAAAKAGSNLEADDGDRFSIGHRFVGHGNRHWVKEDEEYDISLGVEGRLAEDLGYDARIRAYRWDSFESGVNLVHAVRIQEEIAAGRYDVVNPFPGTQATEEAIEAHSKASRGQQAEGRSRFRHGVLFGPAGAGRVRLRDRRPGCGMDGRGRTGPVRSA
jgi:outer membrane receptor protein involved in Fe transport